jgi:hypothetical protein
MMPLFPSPSLKFRPVSFPQSGFKAGISDAAFPVNWFAVALRALCCHRLPLLCVRDGALMSTSVRADLPLYPRGPRSGPGYAVPGHPHLIGPIRPTRRHIPTSPQCGLYEMPSLCAQTRRLGNPERFRAFVVCSLSACRPLRPREVHRLHAPSSFTDDTGLRRVRTVSALPLPPHSDSREGTRFEA